MKANRNKTDRRRAAYKRLEKRINSNKVSQEFLDKRANLTEDQLKKEIDEYWKCRKYELSQLTSKGIK